jgi:hypothetical protein
MSGYYGQADPASMQQNNPGFGAAAAGLMPAPATSTAQGGKTFVENKWKASFRPELAGGAGDFGYQKADGSWAALPQDVRNANQPAFGLATLQAVRGQRKAAADKATNNTINANANERYEDEHNLRIRDLDLRIEEAERRGLEAERTLAITLEQVRNQGKSIDNTHTLGLAEINQRGDERKDAMTVRNEELRMSREQMQLNNQLQGRKLDMEDQHFQQQAALDHKNSRRTQVMNALTLIAQSAAKL